MPDRIFFYDDRDLAAIHNLHLAPGPVKKLGPVEMQKRACDFTEPSCFAGSVIPMPTGGYRLYYSEIDRDSPRRMRLAYAESEDGLQWTKPDLGQMEWQDEPTNWIWPQGQPEVGQITQPQVCPLPDGSWRMWYWWHGREVGRFMYVAAESEDGIQWSVIDLQMPHILHPADRELRGHTWAAGLTEADVGDEFEDECTMDFNEARRLRSNDANYVYYNPDREIFELYQVWLMPVDEATGRVTPHDNAPGVLRTIARRESSDGLQWSDPEMLILADEHDPLHQQFYYLAVQPDNEWNIGMLGHYRCWEQTMDLELCFSREGREWIRPLRGGWIPRGGVDEQDYMSVYATDRMMDRGESWLLLYNGGNRKHNHELPEGVTESRGGIMAAEVPKGRFAGLQTTDRTIGSLTLRRFNCHAPEITVDASVWGRLRAELRDPYDRPLSGYELNSCSPITGDSHRHVLRWEEGKTSEPYQWDVVSLRVEIEDGMLYSIEI